MKKRFFKPSLLLLIVVSMLSMSFKPNQAKLLMVIPPVDFQDVELFEPLKKLDSAKISYVIASTVTGTIKGVLGDSIKSTLLITDVKIEDFDAICIMGGQGTGKHLWNNATVKTLLIGFNEKGKYVTGICAGSVALAKSGVLKDKNATTYPVAGFIKQLEENGAKYQKELVVIDGKIITGDGPTGAKPFGEALVKVLK